MNNNNPLCRPIVFVAMVTSSRKAIRRELHIQRTLTDSTFVYVFENTIKSYYLRLGLFIKHIFYSQAHLSSPAVFKSCTNRLLLLAEGKFRS